MKTKHCARLAPAGTGYRPAPPKVHKSRQVPAHPTYGKMIETSIKEINDRKGASKQAILKYMCSHFNLGENIRQINTHMCGALVRAVDAKTILQVTGSGANGRFRLPDKKKKREVEDTESGEPVAKKRKPGRPPKNPVVPAVANTPAITDTPAATDTPATTDEEADEEPAVQPKPIKKKKTGAAGSKGKSKSKASGVAGKKSGAGRKKKTVVAAAPAAAAEPTSDVEPSSDAIEASVTAAAPKPRGRPKKVVASTASNVAASVPSSMTATPKPKKKKAATPKVRKNRQIARKVTGGKVPPKKMTKAKSLNPSR